MGIRDLFKKAQHPKEEDVLLAGIQMVDRWLLEEKEPYKLYMDTTVPVEHGRRKESKYDEAEKKFELYEKKTNEILQQHGIEQGTMFDLDEFHKWMQVFGTTMFFLVSYAPSTLLRRQVMLDEAISYFNDVFMKTEKLCKEISERMAFSMFQLETNDETVEFWSSSGVSRREDLIIEDYQDLEQCEQLINMITSQYDYYMYLLNISADIYTNVPYFVDTEGNYRKINNVEKTFANIMQYCNADNRDAGMITKEQFWNLVE